MEKINPQQLHRAAALLKEGKIVAFPTETVYGLGVVYDSREAFDRLVEIKRRRPDKPFTLMCSSVGEISKYATLNPKASAIIKAFLPGELTIIMDVRSSVPPWVHLGTGHIGIRVPDDDGVREMIRLTGKPLLVPSANRADQRPLTSDDEVIKEFEADLDAIVLGHSKGATPSTVVAAYDKIIMIREGNISLSQIKKVTGE